MRNGDLSRLGANGVPLFFGTYGNLQVARELSGSDPVPGLYAPCVLRLSRAQNDPNAALTHRFFPPAGTGTVTVMVRFRAPGGTGERRGEIVLARGADQVARMLITGEDVAAGWQTRALVLPAGATPSGLPVNLEIFPNRGAAGTTGDLLLDGVWAVAGSFAATYRSFGHAVEVLPEPLPVDSRSDAATGTTVGLPPEGGIPARAVGCVLQVRVSSLKSGVSLRVGTEAPLVPPRAQEVFVQVPEVPAVAEVTLALPEPAPGAIRQFHLGLVSPSTTTPYTGSYEVSVKQWFYR